MQDDPANSPLAPLLFAVFNSNITLYNHRAVITKVCILWLICFFSRCLQLMEIITRYWKIYIAQPNLIPVALDFFLNAQGLRHRNAHVRSRYVAVLDLRMVLIAAVRPISFSASRRTSDHS